MSTLDHVCDYLTALAPPYLAAEWDNVGLLVGDRGRSVERIMTCLSITPDVAAEAVAERADLIVAHHPLPFRPLKRLTSDTVEGRTLLALIGASVAIYSAHTAFDSTLGGVNEQLAALLGLADVRPLTALPDAASPVGVGRIGRAPQGATLRSLAERLKAALGIRHVQAVGSADRPLSQIAIGCGGADDLLPLAEAAGAQCFVTGEARFHTCLAAESSEIALLLLGHYASERFAQQELARVLAKQYPALTIWPSRRERDPLGWI